jgi:hypothetical protein
MKSVLSWSGIGFFVILSVADPASAIPAFARKYEMSCTQCHAPAPRLNRFGELFAAHGFRMEDPSQEPTQATMDTGDPLLRLVRDFPLAARIEGFAAYKEDAAAETDFEWPWAFKILSGGPISDKISYYFYYSVEGGGSGKLEDAYLQFNRPFNLPFNLLFGQLQVADPIFKRELRLERNDYSIYTAKVGSSSTRLTYDRGVMAVSTLPGGIDMVLGIYNGTGINPTSIEGRPAGGTSSPSLVQAADLNYDGDPRKSFSARLSRQFGWVRIGLFGFEGREDRMHFDMEEQRYWEDTNTVRYWGPDFVVDISETLQFSAQYLERTDNRAYFYTQAYPYEVNIAPATTRGGFAELTWLPKGPEGRWGVSLLYNNIDTDGLLDEAAENASVTINYLMARNIRFLAEIENDFEAERVKASVGVSAAF